MGQAKALAYAEDSLGVHRIWVEAESVTVRLQELYRMRAGFEAETRTLNLQVEKRKNQILVDTSLANPEAGPTAMDRLVKLANAQDENLDRLHELLAEAMGRRDSIEAEIRGAETNHKAYLARMKELGGYFEYLATIKAAQTSAMEVAQQWPY